MRFPQAAAVIPADGDDVELGSVPFGIIIRSISLDPGTSPTRGRAVRIHAARHIPARADRGERWAPFGGRSLREKVPNTPLDFIVTKHGPRLTDRVDAQEHSRGLLVDKEVAAAHSLHELSVWVHWDHRHLSGIVGDNVNHDL